MKLIWDKQGERFYETGISHGVLYKLDEDNEYVDGVVWNGLTAVTESPSGAEPEKLYADNIPYLTLMSAEELSVSIEAYSSPVEFDECDGIAELATGILIGQQPRKKFGLSYRTVIGNDTDQDNYGYKIHLLYGGLASPSEKNYSTISDSPEAMALSWEVSTTPVEVTGYKPTALLTIDSTLVSADKLAALEEVLYGTEEDEPRLPLPSEVVTLLA